MDLNTISVCLSTRGVLSFGPICKFGPYIYLGSSFSNPRPIIDKVMIEEGLDVPVKSRDVTDSVANNLEMNGNQIENEVCGLFLSLLLFPRDGMRAR